MGQKGKWWDSKEYGGMVFSRFYLLLLIHLIKTDSVLNNNKVSYCNNNKNRKEDELYMMLEAVE